MGSHNQGHAVSLRHRNSWTEVVSRPENNRQPVVDASSELARLAGEIDWYQEEARKTVMLALQYKLEIGRRLARARALLPHGKFLSWARSEFGWTPRHIQSHLMLAKNAKRISGLPPDTSLRMALAAIREINTDSGDRGSTQAVESISPRTIIHIVGKLEPGTIDRDRLLAEIAKVAADLGAERMQWAIH